MNDVVTIENTEMQIREYNGQRVVTFKDIDNAHGNKPGTARRNFNRNKKRFIEGEDYFFLTKEISNETILPISNISVPNRGITILTESGYLLISKSFNDDLSWNVQRQLVNTYFKAKQERDIFTNTTQKIPFRTSSTPVPRNPNWYQRNRRRLNRIAYKANMPLSSVYHYILVRLGEEFNLDAANEIYSKELGHSPQYAIDIVSYFPELGKLADDYLNRLEEI